MIKQLVEIVKKNCLCYIVLCAALPALNFLYRSGDSSLLTWILAPTARWAGILGGLSFEPYPGRGYVNETFRFLIAPSCSGIRFLQIVLLVLVFSYTHQIQKGRRKLLWLPFCFGFSYLYTILVNGLRIVLAIYLPQVLDKADLFILIPTPEGLHLAIGVVVYFTFLLMLPSLAGKLAIGLFGLAGQERRRTLLTLAAPVFWYVLAVLGVPFLKRLATGDVEGFGQYALQVIRMCLCILLPVCGCMLLGRRRRRAS